MLRMHEALFFSKRLIKRYTFFFKRSFCKRLIVSLRLTMVSQKETILVSYAQPVVSLPLQKKRSVPPTRILLFSCLLKKRLLKKIKHVSYAFKIEDFNISFAYFCFPFEPFLYPLFYEEGIPNKGYRPTRGFAAKG